MKEIEKKIIKEVLKDIKSNYTEQQLADEWDIDAILLYGSAKKALQLQQAEFLKMIDGCDCDEDYRISVKQLKLKIEGAK